MDKDRFNKWDSHFHKISMKIALGTRLNEYITTEEHVLDCEVELERKHTIGNST